MYCRCSVLLFGFWGRNFISTQYASVPDAKTLAADYWMCTVLPLSLGKDSLRTVDEYKISNNLQVILFLTLTKSVCGYKK
jgi:hypothetical protein